jgi:surface-anchored protein
VKRLPSFAAFFSACAVAAAVVLPGVGTTVPAHASPAGKSVESQPDPSAVEPIPFDEAEISVGEGKLAFGSDGENPVYLLDQDDPGTSAQAEFEFRPQYSEELDQPYSFAVTRIAGGSLAIEEHLGRNGDRTKSLVRIEDTTEESDDGTAADEIPELDAYDGDAGELWAFDIDHDFTSTWTLNPALSLDALEGADDELGEPGDDESGEPGDDDLGSTEGRSLTGAEDRKLGETEDSGSDESGDSESVESEETREDERRGASEDDRGDGDGDSGTDTEPKSGADTTTEAATGDGEPGIPLQRVCVAVESRSTDERVDADGTALAPTGDRAEQVLTFVFGDHEAEAQKVVPCAEDPKAFADERKLKGLGDIDAEHVLPEEIEEFDSVVPKMDAYEDESENGRGDGTGEDAGDEDSTSGVGDTDENGTGDGVDEQKSDRAKNVHFQQGPGLDFTTFSGEGNDWAGIRFHLFEAPEESALVYRNSNHRPEGMFHDHGYNERVVREGQTSDVYHRATPTRDAHASWGFTKDGVYCLAVAVRTYADNQEQRELEVEPIIRTIVVGDDQPIDSVNCGEQDPGDIKMPALPAPPENDNSGSGGGDDNGVNGKVPTGGSGDEQGMNGSGSDSTDDGMNAPGSNPTASEGAVPTQAPTPSPTESTPATRVQQAPPVIRPCPATANSEVQVREGRLNLTAAVQGAGLAAEFVDMRKTPPTGVGTSATVVIPDRATRDLTSSLDSFAEQGTTVWTTETLDRGGVPQLGWDLSALSDAEVSGPVTVSVQRVEGPGHFAILSEEAGLLNLLADSGESVDLDAGSQGIGAFAFTQPGNYTVTLDVSATSQSGQQLGPASVKLNFVVGDTNTAASDSPMLRALLGECTGIAAATNVMDYAGEPQPQQAAPSLDQAQEGILGDTWWVIAGVTMGVAGLLGLAVLIVLMRESRR